jgi:hypothetical protein
MAEETTAGLGEALGLQTSATPYSGSPIFRGLQTGLQYEMKREALKAKEAAEEEKKRLAFEKSITSPIYPRVGKRWQKAMEHVASETLYGMHDAANRRDRVMQEEFKTKGRILGNSIAAQNDYENRIRNSKAILPKTVSQSLDSDDDTGITQTDYKWHDYIQPVDMGMIGANQRYSFNLLQEVQPMDIRKENAALIKDMRSNQPLTETGTFLRNYFGVKQELSDDDLKEAAHILVGQNSRYRINTLREFEDEGKKILQNYIKKGLQYDEAKELALEDLAFNKLKEVNEPIYKYKGENEKDSLPGYKKRIFDEINTETLPVADAVGMVTKIVMDKKGLKNKLGVEGGVKTVLSPEIQSGAEYQMVVLPIDKKRVKLKTTGGQMVDMVPETFVEINNYVGDDINGIYVLGSTSVLGGNDVDFNIKGFKFNKAVKVTNENIGSIATSKGMSVKDLAEFVNAKVGYEYITPQITQTKANKSTSTGGGKKDGAKGKGGAEEERVEGKVNDNL